MSEITAMRINASTSRTSRTGCCYRAGYPDALLERIDQVEQLVALPDAAPLALVEPVQDSRALELLQSLAGGDVGLACERLGDRDVDHGLLRQRTDELPDGGVPAWLAEVVEPG